MKVPFLIGALFISNYVNAEPFHSADAKAGKALADKHCVSCHAASFGGDGSAIYTRDSRKVTSAKKLASQIRNCNTMLGLKWFEDEELNVAKYLNQTYYRFSE
jgi:mono/diheme cytochrome c family protein